MACQATSRLRSTSSGLLRGELARQEEMQGGGGGEDSSPHWDHGIVVYAPPTIYPATYSVDGYAVWKSARNAACRCRCGNPLRCCECAALFPESFTLHHETGTWVDTFWNSTNR